MFGPELAVAAVILVLAATLQGYLGFGFGMAAMSGLTFTHDLVHASGVVNLTGGALTLAMVWRLRRAVRWRTVGRVVPALLAGVLLGVTALGSLDRTLMVRALGVSIVGISAWNLLAPRLHPRESLGADSLAGFLAGCLGGAFNTGGPPLVAHLYRRPDTPDALRGTIQTCFLAIALTRAPAASAQGLLGGEVWAESALLLPGVLLGLALGARLGRGVAHERFQRAAWVALGLMGAVLFARA